MKTNLEIKLLQDALIYTKQAFARIFGVLPQRIIRAQVWWSGYWIIIKGKRPRLYKKSLFEVHFAAFRKESARQLTISTYIPGATTKFYVKNDEKNTTNYVDYSRDAKNKPRYECGCHDFKAMQPAFKAPACKHVYAVLFYQGFETMAASIAQHRKEFEARSALGI